MTSQYFITIAPLVSIFEAQSQNLVMHCVLTKFGLCLFTHVFVFVRSVMQITTQTECAIPCCTYSHTFKPHNAAWLVWTRQKRSIMENVLLKPAWSIGCWAISMGYSLLSSVVNIHIDIFCQIMIFFIDTKSTDVFAYRYFFWNIETNIDNFQFFCKFGQILEKLIFFFGYQQKIGKLVLQKLMLITSTSITLIYLYLIVDWVRSFYYFGDIIFQFFTKISI